MQVRSGQDSLTKTAPRVWTRRRRLLGNLVPAFFSMPLAVAGLLMMASQARDSGQILGSGLLVFFLSFPVGWFAVNLFGLFQNTQIHREMRLRLQASGRFESVPTHFVGFASPSYVGLLDPYEDVGFVLMHPDRLEFVGDSLRLSLKRDHVTRVRLRPNLYTFLGLGCWIVIDGLVGDVPIQMRMGLRERPTLLGNLLLAPRFRKELEDWIRQT